MEEQTTITVETTGFWSVIDRGVLWLIETEVSIAVVLVLVFFGVLVDLARRWLGRFRGPKQ